MCMHYVIETDVARFSVKKWHVYSLQVVFQFCTQANTRLYIGLT